MHLGSVLESELRQKYGALKACIIMLKVVSSTSDEFSCVKGLKSILSNSLVHMGSTVLMDSKVEWVTGVVQVTIMATHEYHLEIR